jgi:DNA processing protein
METRGGERPAAVTQGSDRSDAKQERDVLWLKLMQMPQMTPALLRRLTLQFGGPQEVFSQHRSILCACGIEDSLASALSRPDWDKSIVEKESFKKAIAWLQAADNHLVSMVDDNYPALLRQISDYPPVLFVAGDPQILNRPMIAIVGSRNSTVYGRETAYRLSAELAQKGFVICSGLAAGIDTEAHSATVGANSPTVAVLGNGLFDIYPPRNRGLAKTIINADSDCQGALVSELALDAGALPSHFPSRNRIISGMSLGVCVVEANLRSGSLITARLALEQNREVFAVPGSVNSARSKGCHLLLRQGATLVECADDIVAQIENLLLGQLDLMDSGTQQAASPKLRAKGHCQALLLPEAAAVLSLIGDDPISTDALVQRSGLSISTISPVLLSLELDAYVFKANGCWQRLNRR